MPKPTFTILVLTILFIACKRQVNTRAFNDLTTITAKKSVNNDSLKTNLKLNIKFFADSLLKGRNDVMQFYMKDFQPDSCGIITYSNSDLKSEFDGIRVLPAIIKNKKADTVFVMPTFNYCDDGESYCFFNEKLPRLYTDSYCCQPDNLFVLKDIDEDGTKEIGIYYSSCASRYKSLRIYSLKKRYWKEIATSDFDIVTQDPRKVHFQNLIKKISKGKFKICNYINGNTKWVTVTMQ